MATEKERGERKRKGDIPPLVNTHMSGLIHLLLRLPIVKENTGAADMSEEEGTAEGREVGRLIAEGKEGGEVEEEREEEREWEVEAKLEDGRGAAPLCGIVWVVVVG